jgi:cysteinyl-tRNA synthetase
MRLYDLRLGQVTDVEPARRRLLRLSVAAPAPGDRADLGDLRTFVTGDLIRRNAERLKLVIQAGQDAGGAADGAALGQRPPEETHLDGVADVQVGGPDPGDRARHWTAAGPVQFDGDADGDPGGRAVHLDDLTGRGLDPLALRLAFLEQPYRDELRLTWPALAAADQALRAWRALVAEWATHPSRPLSAPHAAEVTAAFDSDLFAPGALVTLRALAASPQVPPGAKFETFAHLDALLGLDLAREIGR